MSKGLFVSFEGGEGSGKTTVLSHIVDKISDLDIEYVITREPGGCDIAEQIRHVILDTSNVLMNKRTEALLYAASRAQHVDEKLLPFLNSGKLVLCDRYVDSSIIYQGFARGNNIEDIKKINEFAMDGLLPDITIFLDILPEDAFARIEKYSRSKDRLDLESIDFHKKVYYAYKELAKQDRFYTVDANRCVDDVVCDVYNIIYSELVKRGICG